MIKRVLTLAAAISAMAAAAGVCVVALAYALYAVARDNLTLSPAAASAIVAGVAALLIVVLALLAFRKAQPKSLRRAAGAEEPTLTTRLIELARERPIVAAAGAVAASLIIARNPAILRTVLSAAVAGRAARPPEARKR